MNRYGNPVAVLPGGGKNGYRGLHNSAPPTPTPGANNGPDSPRRGPLYVNPDANKENEAHHAEQGEVLPGSPMIAARKSVAQDELLRARQAATQESAKKKRFELLLSQVEREVGHKIALKKRNAKLAAQKSSAGAVVPFDGTDGGSGSKGEVHDCSAAVQGAVTAADTIESTATPTAAAGVQSNLMRRLTPGRSPARRQREVNENQTPRSRLRQVVSAWNEEAEAGSASSSHAISAVPHSLLSTALPITPTVTPAATPMRSAAASVAGVPRVVSVQPTAATTTSMITPSPKQQHLQKQSVGSLRKSPSLALVGTPGGPAPGGGLSPLGLLAEELPAPTPFRARSTECSGNSDASSSYYNDYTESSSVAYGDTDAHSSSETESDGAGSNGGGSAVVASGVRMVDVAGFLELGHNTSSDMTGMNTTPHDMDLLRTACAYGNLERTATLLRQGQHIDAVDSEGRTPLMYAVHCERHEVAALLISQGAALDACAYDGSTALHRAAFGGSTRMLMLLVEAGANHLIADEEGRLPLHWSVHNTKNTGCLSALIKRVKPNALDARDQAGMTAAMWAAYLGAPEHLTKLLRHGASMAATDEDGKTLVHWAVSGRRSGTACLRQVLSFENSDVRDGLGKSVLHHAAEAGAVKACKFITSLRATSVNDLDANGRSPLHWASVCGKARAIRALMKRGANPHALDTLGRSPLDYAREREFNHCLAVMRGEPVGGLPATDTSAEPVAMEQYNNDEGPSPAVMELFQMLTRGTYLTKFTGGGKGAAHRRYFWVDALTGEFCWTKSPAEFAKNPEATQAQEVCAVESTPSLAVRGRKDYDPDFKHRYAFSVVLSGRVLDLVAPSEDIFMLWVHGLAAVSAFSAETLCDGLTIMA